jgi:translocator protein
MDQPQKYQSYVRPVWSPASWLFGPVWSVLYFIIFVSFGYVFKEFVSGNVTWIFVLPFVINLIANFAFTYLEFGLGAHELALLDIFVVWVTLIVIMHRTLSTENAMKWVGLVNIPYLLWTSYAFILQTFIVLYN